jgi:hypothetical protein
VVGSQGKSETMDRGIARLSLRAAGDMGFGGRRLAVDRVIERMQSAGWG